MAISKETRLKLAIGISSVFCIVEVIGGIWSNSLAILSDASHLLTDIAGFVIALLATIVAKRAASKQYTFGLVRAEVFGALLSVMTLWLITAVLLYSAYFRAYDWFKGKSDVVDGKLMSFVALFGVGVNICLATVFHEEHGGAFHSHDHAHGNEHSHGHDHGHNSPQKASGYGAIESGEHDHSGHSHDHSGHSHDHHDHSDEHDDTHTSHGNDKDCEDAPLVESSRTPVRDVNLEAAYLHVLTDLAQSTGVAIAGFIIWYKPHWEIVDPLCTLMFSIFVVWSTLDIIKRIVSILLEGVPADVDWSKVKEALETVPGVSDVHDLHIWSMSSKDASLTCHMRAKDPQSALKESLKRLGKMGLSHVTIQVQEEGDEDGCTLSSTNCHA